MPAESAAQALAILRDGSLFQWYVIPLFAFVVYVYFAEIERRAWAVVAAGLAFWGLDWFNEIWNSILFHATGFAPAWGAPGKTAYLILIGLNIEICFMFAIAGITFAKILPPDPKMKILGIPNRIFIAVTSAAFCVFVEILLNAVGALTWEWPWWNARMPLLIFVFGYLYFFLVAFWVHDRPTNRARFGAVGVIWGIDLVAVLVFGLGLGWL